MSDQMPKRDFLRVGLGFVACSGALRLGSAQAQEGPGGAGATRMGRALPPVPVVKARTTVMWQVPKGAKGEKGAPNALAWDTDNRGLWYGEEEGPLGDRKNNEAVLLDLNGKELKRIKTSATNVSGMAQGGGYIWMGSSGPGFSFYRVSIATGEEKGIVTALSPPASPSRATHGMAWDDDNKKLWVADPQMGVLTRMDPQTLQADRIIKADLTHFSRLHGTAYYQGALYQVGWVQNVPDAPTDYATGHGGIIKYDLNTGRPSLYIDFVPNSIDPHAIAIDKAGKMYVCDSGFHPGIPDRTPPYTGDVGYVTVM